MNYSLTLLSPSINLMQNAQTSLLCEVASSAMIEKNFIYYLYEFIISLFILFNIKSFPIMFINSF